MTMPNTTKSISRDSKGNRSLLENSIAHTSKAVKQNEGKIKNTRRELREVGHGGRKSRWGKDRQTDCSRNGLHPQAPSQAVNYKKTRGKTLSFFGQGWTILIQREHPTITWTRLGCFEHPKVILNTLCFKITFSNKRHSSSTQWEFHITCFQ